MNNIKPLENLKNQFGLVEKVSKRFQRYMGIVERGVITKQETINLKSILSDRGLRGKLTDYEVETLKETFETVKPGKIRITPEHTEQGLNFFKALIYTPTGKVRARWQTYLDNIDSAARPEEIREVIDNFSHFEFAGFDGVDYNAYRDAYNYMPIWRTVAKDGTAFAYTQCQDS